MQAPSKLFHSIIIIGAALGTGCAGADQTSSDATTTTAPDASIPDGETGIPVIGDVTVGEVETAYDDAPMPWW